MTYSFNKELFLSIVNKKNIDTEHFVDIYGNVFSQDSFPAVPSSDTKFRADGSDSFSDNFRAPEIEWGGFALAIQLARDKMIDPVLCELGASQGLWCAPWVRMLSGFSVNNSYAMGIEASPSVDEVLAFWNLQSLDFEEELTDTGVRLYGDSFTFDWANYAVSHADGVMKFPDIRVNKNNGAAIDNAMNHDIPRLVDVVAITPDQILSKVKSNSEYDSIGVLHVDLQGEELKLLRGETLNNIISNTSILILGTHSLDADEEFPLFLSASGMTLVGSQPSEYNEAGILVKDGEQIWIKTMLVDYCINKQYLV